MMSEAPLTISKCSHFIFTDFPKEKLEEQGFVFPEALKTESQGLVIHRMPLRKPSGEIVDLEFARISDEEEFQNSVTQKKSNSSSTLDLLRPKISFESRRQEPEYSKTEGERMVGAIPVSFSPLAHFPERDKISVTSPFVFRGVYWNLSQKDRVEWTQFLGAPPTEEAWCLADGTRIELAQAGDGLFEFMSTRKDFSFWAVILECDSLAALVAQGKIDQQMVWRGQPVGLIREYLTDWDIILIEKS